MAHLNSWHMLLCFSLLCCEAGAQTTLQDKIGPLLVSPPAGFNIKSIAKKHPRFIDIKALRDKIDAPAYADMGGSGKSARRWLAEAGDSAKPDPVANALLWHLDGNTTRRDRAKADLLANTNFAYRPTYWNSAPQAFPGVMLFWCYDLLADELTTAEKQLVWNNICTAIKRNANTFAVDDRHFRGLHFWVNDTYNDDYRLEYGSSWSGWWALLAFAHDGVADQLISKKIAEVVNGNSRDIHSPWDTVNANYCANQGQGGSHAGKYRGFGGSYYYHFTHTHPQLLIAHDRATGDTLAPKYTISSKLGQDFWIDSAAHFSDNNGRFSLAHATGMASGVDAGLARWAQEKESSVNPYGYIARIITEDLRVAPVSPAEAGLPLYGQTLGCNLWSSLTGYDITPGGTDTRVRVMTRRMELERIPSECGALAINVGSNAITSNGDSPFNKRDAYTWSNQVTKEPNSGKTLQRAPFFAKDWKPLRFARAKTPNQVFSQAKMRWTPPVEQEGPGWAAVKLDATKWHVTGDYGLTGAFRTVFHHRTKNIVIVWDKIEAPLNIQQGITFRHLQKPRITDNTWTVAGARFQVLKPADASVSWLGGSNKEIVDIFDETTVHRDRRDKLKLGYSDTNPAGVENIGLGAMRVLPASPNATQIYLTVIDVESQYAPATLRGDTVEIDDLNITIGNHGMVNVKSSTP